jgi:hypothetical protein
LLVFADSRRLNFGHLLHSAETLIGCGFSATKPETVEGRKKSYEWVFEIYNYKKRENPEQLKVRTERPSPTLRRHQIISIVHLHTDQKTRTSVQL